MSKGWKYILISIAGFILLISTLLFLTQTSFFREKVKNQLIIIVKNQLNLRLEIERIDGNFYDNLSIHNIRFIDNDSTVASFQSLKLDYDLLPLIYNDIRVDSVIIRSPKINLWQNNDSIWNVKGYLKQTAVKKEKKQFAFRINAGFVSIRNGTVSVSSVYKTIPSVTEDLNLTANGSFRKKKLRVQLKELGFVTKDSSLVLKNLSGIFNQDPDGIQLDSLQITTERSNIDLEGSFVSTENLQSNIKAQKIDKNELALFVPSFRLKCSPSLNVDFSTSNNRLSANAELEYNNQSVKAKILVQQFKHLVNKSGQVPYSADLHFENFKVEDWIDFPNKSALLFGNIVLEGTNLLDVQSPLKIVADLHKSQYNEIPFNTLSFDGNYTNNSLKAFLDVSNDFGSVKANGNLWNISEMPEYDVEIETNRFNLTAYIPKIKGTKINGTIIARGKGFTVEDLFTNGTVNLHNSSVYNFHLDTLKSQLSLQNLNLNIDTLQIQVPGANATASGILNLDSLYLESIIYMDIDSLTVIDSLVVLPVAFDSARTVSTITGPLRELKIGGDIEIFNADGYSSKIGETHANYLVILKEDSLRLDVNASSGRIEMAGTEWDSLKVEFGMFQNEFDIFANVVWKDTINAKIKTSFKTGDSLYVVVPNFEVKTVLSDYYLADTMTTTIFKNENLEIKNLIIKDQNRPDFIFSANGTISTSETNNFKLLIEQLDLSQLNRFIQEQDSVKGIVGAEVTITGTAGNPEVAGTVTIENPGYGVYGLTSLNSKFSYSDKLGFAEVTTPDLGDDFYTSISTSFEAYFDSLNFVFSKPDTFNASLILDSLQVSQSITKLMPNDSVNGVINANITASGDFKNPLIYGGLDLVNGHFESKKLGINYDEIKTSILFDGKKITLDTVNVKQEGGLISVTGEVEFDSTIVKGKIISSSLKADANNFFITSNRNYEILIDANTFVKTGAQNPEFGGQIKVIRSDVFLPAVLSKDRTKMENDTPMLVEALFTEGDTLLVENLSSTKKTKKLVNTAELMSNLTGKLNVEIPRNTWIKSDNMRIELSGDVDIIKSASYFELFGNIDVLRGYYMLYGKKLNIKEGQIIFQGGEELDPNLSFITEYVYRGNDKQKRYLSLLITGKVSEPEITFMLDGAEISETDGISVLIFGATSDEIGYSGQNGIVSSIGFNAVANVISSQLSKTVGTQLNLDMIEVTATENWQSAAFVVGKYITNDIFVIYQRGFGEVEGDEITPETITIEYELNEKLMLRLQSGSSTTSGMDVILKFEQEMKDKKSGKKKNE
ncbi:translocation/assembly module TamB domain-containing protein [Draconibacterium sp.]|nr:translocation/assembly module TamB domain-containing protein [Draconibacterium sp.]